MDHTEQANGRWLEATADEWRRIIGVLRAERWGWTADFVRDQLRRELGLPPSPQRWPVLVPREARQQAALRAAHGRVVGMTVTR